MNLFKTITKNTTKALSNLLGKKSPFYGDIHSFEKVIAVSDLYASGQVHLISIQNIKDQLGLRWYGQRSEILKKLTEKIKHYTDSEDIFFSRSDTEHMIVFATLPEEEAQQLCGNILKELSAKFIGRTYDHDIIIRTAVGRKNGKLLFNDVPYSSKMEIPTAIPEVKKAPIHQLEAFVSQIKPKKKRPYELIYKPTWDKKNNIVSTFMVSVRSTKKKKGESNTTSPIGYHSLPNPYCLASMIELDRYMLDEIVEMMQDFFKNNFRAMFSIPLHYKTLFNLTRLHNFLFHCQSIPDPLRKYITFSLVGFPEGFPEARMHLIITSLQKFCHDVTIVCDSIPTDISYFQGCGIKGICLQVSEKTKNKDNYQERIQWLSEKCAKENIDLSIDGVDRFDELKTIKETELSHISGNIVGKYSDAPTHMAHMKWDDLVKH